MYSPFVLCILLCAFGYDNRAWQDQHCDDFGVCGGLRGFKEQVPGLKTAVALGDMVGEYLRDDAVRPLSYVLYCH